MAHDILQINLEKMKVESGITMAVMGKLKIFIGYAPGVGKTYTMLSAAHEDQKEGMDVIVGYIDYHARKDTLNLLKGLEVLPSMDSTSNNSTITEFDLDRALQRNPELVLLDNLAHVNEAGGRHKKGIRMWRSFFALESMYIPPLTSSRLKAWQTLCTPLQVFRLRSEYRIVCLTVQIRWNWLI